MNLCVIFLQVPFILDYGHKNKKITLAGKCFLPGGQDEKGM
jgi:hypothetical protein